MNRVLVGALAALLLMASGLFWWQGRAAIERGAPPPMPVLAGGLPAERIPTAEGKGLRGPAPPEADETTREQRRFNRLDRDRDNAITRNEMLLPRVAAFRALDTDHNNLLSFEEWAVRTSNRFKAADADGNLRLTRAEFATTRPKRRARPACRCPQSGSGHASAPSSADDDGEP
jgi:hypothetical protein